MRHIGPTQNLETPDNLKMSKAKADEIDTDEEAERAGDYGDMMYSVDEFGRPMVQFVDGDFWNGKD